MPDTSAKASIGKFVDEFPWTDVSTLEAHLTFAHAYAVLTAMLARKYSELGLSIARFNALRLLYHSDDGRLRVSELGVRLGITSASVTRLVDGLVRDGWVVRTNDDLDKRVTYVQFVPSGSNRFASLLPTVLNIWNDVWAGLSPEERTILGRLNSKLRSGLLRRMDSDTDLELQEY